MKTLLLLLLLSPQAYSKTVKHKTVCFQVMSKDRGFINLIKRSMREFNTIFQPWEFKVQKRCKKRGSIKVYFKMPEDNSMAHTIKNKIWLSAYGRDYDDLWPVLIHEYVHTFDTGKESGHVKGDYFMDANTITTAYDFTHFSMRLLNSIQYVRIKVGVDKYSYGQSLIEPPNKWGTLEPYLITGGSSYSKGGFVHCEEKKKYEYNVRLPLHNVAKRFNLTITLSQKSRQFDKVDMSFLRKKNGDMDLDSLPSSCSVDLNSLDYRRKN